MSEVILLRAQAPDLGAPASWCVQAPGTANTFGAREPQRGSLAEGLSLAGNRRLVLIIPGEDVLLTSVQLPIKQTAKLLQAVPYALEDRLAEDPETLHFALGPRLPTGEVSVAVISRQRLDAWQQILQSQGASASVIVPDTLCLPPPESGQASVLIQGSHALVRTGIATGFVGETELLSDLLALESLALSTARLWHTGTVPELGGSVGEIHDISDALDLLRRQAELPTLNLLQGAYAPRGNFQLGELPVLRWTAALAAACLVLGFMGLGLTQIQLRSERDELETTLQTQMQSQFPEIKKIVDPRVQAERALSDLRKRGGGGALYERMTALTQAMQSVPGLEVQTLQLRDNTLFLDLIGRDLQTLDKLRAHFESQRRFRLQVLSANASSGAVQIRASLETL